MTLPPEGGRGPCYRERMGMAWTFLLVAAFLEIGWASGLKYTEGFTRPGPTVLVVIALTASMILLAMAARTLPIGTAYAVWTGIGTAGTALLGMYLFGESASPVRLLCIAMIIAGVFGLKLAGDGGH
jgi:quaternary ammonium compound-resistance protein SugE